MHWQWSALERGVFRKIGIRGVSSHVLEILAISEIIACRASILYHYDPLLLPPKGWRWWETECSPTTGFGLLFLLSSRRGQPRQEAAQLRRCCESRSAIVQCRPYGWRPQTQCLHEFRAFLVRESTALRIFWGLICCKKMRFFFSKDYPKCPLKEA